MSAVVDPLAALISVTKADATVAALVGTRVFATSLPPGEAASMPRKCVVYRRSGGATPPYTAATVPLQAQRIDAVCYGENVYEGERVRRALRGLFRDLGRSETDGVMLHWIRPAGGVLEFRDPDADWPGVFESYQLLADERAIA